MTIHLKRLQASLAPFDGFVPVEAIIQEIAAGRQARMAASSWRLVAALSMVTTLAATAVAVGIYLRSIDAALAFARDTGHCIEAQTAERILDTQDHLVALNKTCFGYVNRNTMQSTLLLPSGSRRLMTVQEFVDQGKGLQDRSPFRFLTNYGLDTHSP
jgi:hypothetical protein